MCLFANGTPGLAANFVQLNQGALKSHLLFFEIDNSATDGLLEVKQLAELSDIRVIKLKIFTDDGQRKPQSLASEDQLQARPVTIIVHPASAHTAWRQQPFCLVKTQRTRRDTKVFGKFTGTKKL